MTEQATEKMTEQAPENNPDGRESEKAASTAEGVRKQLSSTSASQLREPALPRRLFGGYSSHDVDELLGRAATTIDGHTEMVAGLRAEVEKYRTEVSAPGPSEEAVSRLLLTAQSVIDKVKEDAQREVEQIIATARDEAAQFTAEARDEAARITAGAHDEAARTTAGARDEAARIAAGAHDEVARITAGVRDEAERAEQLRLTAQAALEGARAEASELVEAARAERERLIADSVGDAAQARAVLEAERSRLEAAINTQMGVWAGRIREALARLDGMELEIDSARQKSARIASVEAAPDTPPVTTPNTDPEPRRPEEHSEQPRYADVIVALNAGLPGGRDVSGPRPAP